MRITRSLAFLALLLAINIAPSTANTPTKTATDDARVLGSSAELLGSGLYRVDPPVGPPLLTHGPDEGVLKAGDQTTLAGVGFAPGSEERAPVCSSDYHHQVVYAHAGLPDPNAPSQIKSIVRRTNAVLNSESLASGGANADYKVACNNGDISVLSVSVGVASSFPSIVSALRSQGLTSSKADYWIFFAGANGGSCGIASYYDDESLSVDNQSNRGGGYAVIYRGCWESEVPMHEVGHTMGAVQYSSPHSTGTGGHCWDERDVMCYSPDGGNKHQQGTQLICPTIRFDCSFDDYFDSAPESGEYLSQNWNLGSPLNRMISFHGQPLPPTEGGGESGGEVFTPSKKTLLRKNQKRATKRGVSAPVGSSQLYVVKTAKKSKILTVRLKGDDLLLGVGRSPIGEGKTRCMKPSPAKCVIKNPPTKLTVSSLTTAGEAGRSFSVMAAQK